MIKNKRIIFVLPSLNLGGAERQALLLGRYLLHERKANVAVWAFMAGSAAELCDQYGIPWRIIPGIRWSTISVRLLQASVKLGLALRSARPDVIMPYLLLPNVLCGLTWRLTRAKLCVWNQRNPGNERKRMAIDRWAATRIPWFIANSQNGADFLTEALRVKPHRIRVIPNGIELAESKGDRLSWRNQLGLNNDCLLVCMVANLTRFKDHVRLLAAWHQVGARLKHTGRRAVLLLAGAFRDTYAPLLSYVDSLKLGDSVRFLGMINDVPGLLGAVDLAVFSSRSEGCPNGVLEAMASGLAVVGTDVPGIRNAVDPKGYPFLAPPGDETTLADNILQLLRDPVLRGDLGAANRRRVQEYFSLESMCEQATDYITRNLYS